MRGSGVRVWGLRAVVLVNAALLFLALNPWWTEWTGQAAVALVVEVALVVVVGVTAVLFQSIIRKEARS